MPPATTSARSFTATTETASFETRSPRARRAWWSARDRITGYATGFGYGWHAVAESNQDVIGLLGSAESLLGLGILVPSRNAQLLRWCLEHGLRIVQQSTLMTIGLYNEPSGAYLPSILF